jgi:hypothetical protein
MILFLFVLGAMYYHARQPSTWRWLVSDRPAANPPVAQVTPNSSPAVETVVPGTTDEDEAQTDDVRQQFEALSDRAPIAATDMPAYWRAMKWSRAQPFETLEQRAAKNVRYAQLWERPEEFRGKLVQLRLHVRQVFTYPAPKNSAGVETVYEARGNTDESKSHPYVVVLSELPVGMPIGNNLNEEAVFVGYFLKLLSYTDALGTPRAAPLLAGRMRAVATPARTPVPPAPRVSLWFWVAVGALVVVMTVSIWLRTRPSPPPRLSPTAPADESQLSDWFSNNAYSAHEEGSSSNRQ